MSEIPISASARVLGVLSPLTYRLTLPNGKEIVGHLAHDLRSDPPSIEVGDEVALEMTPFDFSKGRIVSFSRASAPPAEKH